MHRGSAILGVVSSMLLSNCCILQIVLNSFGMGCAGFRKLEMFRPIWMTFYVISLSICWFGRDGNCICKDEKCLTTTLSETKPLQSAGSIMPERKKWLNKVFFTLVVLLIASSETFVQRLNDRNLQMFDSSEGIKSAQSASVDQDRCMPAPGTAHCHGESNANVVDGNRFNLKIGGMNCEGCRRSLISSLTSVPGIESVDVSLQDGTAFLVLKENFDSITVLTKVKDSIERAGFSLLSNILI